MARPLTSEELLILQKTEPAKFVDIPPEGRVWMSKQLGCVQLFKKTDGTVLANSVPDWPGCKMTDVPRPRGFFETFYCNLFGCAPDLYTEPGKVSIVSQLRTVLVLVVVLFVLILLISLIWTGRMPLVSGPRRQT